MTFLKSKTKFKEQHFEMCAKLFLAVMKAQWDYGSKRILLGINTGNRAVMLWPITFHCVGVWF
jgi:hypothetical protein